MRILVKGNWNFIRIFRLVAGATGTVQGIVMKEFALSLGGFLLVYMAIADAGYCDKNSREVELREISSISKEMNHEKVDAQL